MEKHQHINLEGLIQLVINQEPERLDLVNALKNCKDGYWSSRGCYKFINTKQKDSKLQIQESVVIEHDDLGTIVIDILEDKKIAGLEFIEFLDYG